MMLALLVILCVVKFPQYSIEEAAFGVFGFLYVSVLLSCVYCMNERVSWRKLAGMADHYRSAWGSDTCAYVAGRSDRKASFLRTESEERRLRAASVVWSGAGLLAFLLCLVSFRHTAAVTANADHRVVRWS